ncbi:alpha/beta fold hydrolase [Paraburkholderia sp. MM5477-R1]|uniref:alpha/beta fold hydrolase n=1 Tax=Paraburkholderia sp. MM5477-R1 TaxID=2991062 RepID=UPI003D1EC82C
MAKRGYGDSSKPDGGPNHVNYSKRLMGLDQVEVMRALGFKRFQAVGHDRGARVLHGMLIHYPQAVQRAVMLDIAPADQMYAHTDESFATRYFWWFFHIQPASAAGADDRGRA